MSLKVVARRLLRRIHLRRAFPLWRLQEIMARAQQKRIALKVE
jgi:hypothetical protein